MSVLARSASGLSKAKFKSSAAAKARASGSTSLPTSTGSSGGLKRRRSSSSDDASATPGSPPTMNEVNLLVKDMLFGLFTRNTSSSKTLAAASTGNASDSSPFWTPSVQALSRKLWLPTEIDLPASPWSSWNGCSTATVQNSWFSARLQTLTRPTNYETTYSPSLLSSWLAKTDGGPQQVASDAERPPPSKRAKMTKTEDVKPSAAKARKIRVYPTVEQKATLAQWFGTARWTYNQCLDTIKKDREMKTRKALRQAVVNNECHSTTPWALKTPYEVRDAAMVELLDAYASNFAKKRKNASHQFEIRRRSKKKAPQESIMIRGKCYKKGVFYPQFFGKTPLRSSEPLPDTVDYDCKLTRTRLGQYYLVIPQPLDMASDNQARLQERVVALDPGVRTFQTAYDPSGSVIEFGKGDIGHIYRICSYMDDLQSRIASTKDLRHKARYRMRRAWRKMQWRVRNLVDECHKKIVKFLCSNYSVVLLPAFETQKMVIRNQRKISSKTARAMVTWSHYRFKQRLLFKRQEYPWCKVVVCDEAYTSKTCGQCGALNHHLGSNKMFHCPRCRATIDRDVNGARNILLKNSSLFGFAATETLGLTPSLGNQGAWSFGLVGASVKNC